MGSLIQCPQIPLPMQNSFTPLLFVYQHFPNSGQHCVIDFKRIRFNKMLESDFEKYVENLPELSNDLLERIIATIK